MKSKLCIVVAVALLPLGVAANNGQEETNRAQANRNAKADARQAEKCQRIAARLAAKSTKSAVVQARMAQRYAVVEERWARIVARAKDSQVDAAKLESALDEYKALHATFGSDFQKLVTLQRQWGGRCGQDSDVSLLKHQVKERRDAVKADADKLRLLRQKTHRETLVPLLKEMAGSKPGAQSE